MKRLLSLSMCLMITLLSFAHDFKVDGIYYKITSSAEPYTVEVTYRGTSYSSYSNEYTGAVTIPETVTYSGKTYSVTTIGYMAFYECSGLTSVTIPNSETSIGDLAFYNCSGLTSVTIPNSVTSIGSSAFSNTAWYNNQPDGLVYAGKVAYKYKGTMPANTSITLDEGTLGIAGSAFSGCSGLTSVTIPNSVKSIGSSAFGNCDGLTSIVVENGNTKYDSRDNCNAIIETASNTLIQGCKTTVIPNSVTSIGSSAFEGHSGLTSVTIPNSVKNIGSYAFYNCSGLTSVTIGNSVTSIAYSAFSGVKKVLVNRGTPSLIALWEAGYAPKQIGTEESLPAPKLTVTGQTQTSLSYKIENWYDDYEYNYWDYTYDNVKTLSSSTFVQKNLPPNSEGNGVVVFMPGTDPNEPPYYYFSSDAKTLQFNPSIAQTTKTASSFSLKGMYSEGDAVVTKQVLSVGGKSVEGNEISLKGLTPNSSYSAKYVVTITYGNKQTRDYTKEVKFNTDPLTLTTEQPKVVSLGNVIVSAKANVDDEEENVGFEWRRTDWTSDFASNTGAANMYEGTMEGYIRNLNTDKLWKFRPYYLANDGTYYYGDWVGLDPTNTSYFEPTVHTYAKIDVTGNTALVKGYALGGTDNITVQGFKYWKADANLARAEYGDRADVTAVTIPANAQTIEAEGRVMEATLSGLDYESTYYYVAFAKTAEGTFYGEVKSFATGVNTTGIERIDNSQLTIDNSRRVKGIYTLTGVKVSDDAADVKTLKSGIYIVNGKKVAVK